MRKNGSASLSLPTSSCCLSIEIRSCTSFYRRHPDETTAADAVAVAAAAPADAVVVIAVSSDGKHNALKAINLFCISN